jgi:hypothetical protein
MPQAIVNAGTGDHGEYQVGRHNFLTGAGLCCIARADKVFDSPEHALADRLAVPLQDLAPYLHGGRGLPETLLARTALTQRERAEVAGVRGRDLLQHFCGSLAPDNDGPAVSAPMLSAAAGALLAAELAHSAPGRVALCNGQVALANILLGPHTRWAAVREKYPDCPCTDALYRDHYTDIWPSGTGSCEDGPRPS